MKSAGYLILASAALHIAGVVLAGFAPSALFLIWPAVLYVALYAGLARGIMMVAWITFFVMLFGVAGALSGSMGGTSVPPWVFWAIIAADLAAAAVLFVVIWRGKSRLQGRVRP